MMGDAGDEGKDDDEEEGSLDGQMSRSSEAEVGLVV